MSRLRAPFNYFGGASNVLNWHNEIIQDLRSTYNLTTWVDVFAGSGLYTLNQDPPWPVEVLNDKEDLITNTFKVLRDNPQPLLERMALTEYSQAVYDECRYIEPDDTDLIKAWKWIVLLGMSFAGTTFTKQEGERLRLQTKHQWRYAIKSTAKNMAATVSMFQAKKETLVDVITRLQRVQITNWDFERVLTKFDSPHTMCAIDPPFVPKTRVSPSAYSQELSVEDHERLLDLIANCQGAVLLRGYGNELYENMAEKYGWGRQEQERKCVATHVGKTRGTQGQKDILPSRTEVIWIKRP